MSSTGDPWENVTIRRDEHDMVVVEPDGFDAPTIDLAAIPVSGGVLFVDVTRADRPPRALVSDAYWAQTWLGGVYGDAVARRVADFEDPDFAATSTEAAVHDYLSDTVGRLGLGFWLHRWWPAGCPELPDLQDHEWLLDVEIGALAWLGEALFIDNTPTEALLAPHAGRLAAVMEDLSADGTEGPLATALRAVVDLLSDDVPGYAECVDVLERLTPSALDVEAQLLTLSDGLVARVRASAPAKELAVARSGGPPSSTEITEVRDRGSVTVDWLQVPPRVVLAVERNATWRIGSDAVGGPHLSVRVDARPGFDDTGVALYARAYADGPPHVFPLTYDARLRAFTGERPLRAFPDNAIGLDIFASGYAQRPRLSADAAATAATDRLRVVELIRARREPADGLGSPFVAERLAWQ